MRLTRRQMPFSVLLQQLTPRLLNPQPKYLVKPMLLPLNLLLLLVVLTLLLLLITPLKMTICAYHRNIINPPSPPPPRTKIFLPIFKLQTRLNRLT